MEKNKKKSKKKKIKNHMNYSEMTLKAVATILKPSKMIMSSFQMETTSFCYGTC